MSPNAALVHRCRPPSCGMREDSSCTASAEGTKNTRQAITHSVRLAGPNCAAVDSQRGPTIAAT